MNRKLLAITSLTVMALGLLFAPIQANYIQCLGGPGCFGTDTNDIINGTGVTDLMGGNQGDDFMTANDGDDNVVGDSGDDILFGGAGSDSVFGNFGDDILFAGPDREGAGQSLDGNEHDDTFFVFVGEVTECLLITGDDGYDVVHLIGFGPYIHAGPFGPAGFNVGFVHVVDPVTGGDIFIGVNETTAFGVELINGLLMPDATLLVGAPPQEVQDCFATIPSFGP